jgi:toxin ParE1/3/4
MQLEVAPRALDDLKKIARYIQIDKSGAAVRFVERIWREFDVIAIHPMIFPAADGDRAGFRLGRVGQYMILFRVTTVTVRIERVVHGRRDLRNQLP